MMKQLVFGAFAAALVGQAVAREPEGSNILEFKTMTGVPRPYTLPENAIRGVPGGGLPWIISAAKGELKVDGHLEVEVKGLVFDPNDPVVIERGLAGTNTVTAFRAVVSCLTKDAGGAPATVNLTTAPFPATTGPASTGGGNAKIEAWLNLPSPCIAPIIFVTSPGGNWFAATGN
ncbi:MAG TPA: hypothetical protein VN442_13765 [Bryobacteraceae bacterium]|nr:hypothetical protein [Bryobacteraceae bacterium]